jgi:hypothetical protein
MSLDLDDEDVSLGVGEEARKACHVVRALGSRNEDAVGIGIDGIGPVEARASDRLISSSKSSSMAILASKVAG